MALKRWRNLSLASKIYRLSGTVILIFLMVIGFIFLQFRESLYEVRRQEFKHLVEAGWHILDYHARQAAAGHLSPEEAQQRALQVLRSQRFEHGNYFWVSDLTPRMVMHPITPELEGQDLAEQRDPTGRPLFMVMTEIVSRDGEGFVKYRWSKPGMTAPVSKISYVKGFPAWGWMIGAGFYIDDINHYLPRMLLGAAVVLILVISGALLLVTWVAHSIAIPMGRAVSMIEALEQGDLDHRLRLNQSEEVGRLARAMDSFADNLQHEILTAFDCLARGDFSFEAKGLIREPLERTNARLNTMCTQLHGTLVREQEERTRTEALIAAMGDGVAIFDPELKIVYQNPIHIGLVGNRLGDSCFQAYAQSHSCTDCAMKRSLADGKVHTMERQIVLNGDELILVATTSPVRNATGKIIALIEIARDVTASKQAKKALIESEARYSSLFRDNHSVMLLIDPTTGDIVDANPSACAFYGYGAEQMLRMKISEINTLSAEEVHREMEVARAERRRLFQFRHRLSTGDVRDVEVCSGPILVQGRELLYSIVHDVTDRKQAEARIQYLAFHDPLTGLANRALLEDRLILTLAHALRSNETGALFFIDLDRFKVINDSLGHHAGDLLLQEAGGRLQAQVRATDTVCRSGGDEYILLFPGIGGPTDAAHLAEKILTTFTVAFVIEEREIFISPSIGISLYPGDGADFVTLIRNADAAMYLAKKQGRNNFQFFKPELTLAAQERLLLENALRQALAQDELSLCYQPQIDAVTGKVVGAEALLRWHHPPRGWISPVQFIPIAEECGLIEQIGAWVLATASSQNKHWQDMGYAPIRMAVNVSGRQFRQPDFIEVVDRTLAETGLDPRWLEVEVTENIVMENVEETIQTLMDLKVRNISLAIDDFGTGYSSLSYLRQFPIDRLKIDRSFVADIITNADDAAIASAVISLGKTLNLEVIAEGVETAEQALFLRERQCNTLQGYYFGRPCPPEEFLSLFESAHI